MPVTKLTDATVRALKSPSTQLDYWSKDVPGFGVHVSRGGRKSFFIRYRLNGRQRRLSLGVYPTTSLASAQRKARKALGQVADDKDPAQTKRDQRRGDTVGDLAEIYLEKHAAKKRSFAEDRRIIRSELLPHWRSIKAKDLRRADVRVLLRSLRSRSASRLDIWGLDPMTSLYLRGKPVSALMSLPFHRSTHTIRVGLALVGRASK